MPEAVLDSTVLVSAFLSESGVSRKLLHKEIDELVGKQGRSSFLTEAAWKEVRRLRMLNALEEASSAWKNKDHPELKGSAAKYVEKIRKEDEKRFERVTRR